MSTNSPIDDQAAAGTPGGLATSATTTTSTTTTTSPMEPTNAELAARDNRAGATPTARPGGPASMRSRLTERPGKINAVPVRHPGRIVAVAVIAVLGAMFLHMVVTNPAYNWPFVFEAMRQRPVIEGLLIGTLGVALISMLLAMLIGIVIAVMRLSSNPILKAVAFAWAWFFRGIPRYVLLMVMGALGILFPDKLHLGVPFDFLLTQWFGMPPLRLPGIDANALFSGLFGAIAGMTLSESAYMAEIARAGILSVDPGQREAAQALGMNSRQSMWRVILPQAMRVIVPPTGSEFISMVKDTSLLVALPLTTEMFFQLRSIGSRTYQIFPTLMGAALYYLFFTTVLMFLQSRIERHFSKGYGSQAAAAAKAQMASKLS